LIVAATRAILVRVDEDRWAWQDFMVGGGCALVLVATADAAWSLYARFAVDLSGLSVFERGAAALWDFRPLATALVLVGAIVALAGLREPIASGSAALREPLGSGLAVLAAAHAALAVFVLGAATWVAAAGELGERDELGFVYSSGERTVTLLTQIAAWLPLAVVLAIVAVYATRIEAGGVDRPSPASAMDAAPDHSLGDEMEELWREQLAFGPGRERGRALLGRIRALEAAGDNESARRLAEEMRALARR
jgi:hypothetical protein